MANSLDTKQTQKLPKGDKEEQRFKKTLSAMIGYIEENTKIALKQLKDKF